MRKLLLVLIFGFAGCTVKPTLTDDEERFVEITIALMKARANVAQTTIGDTLNQPIALKSAIDSVYKRFGIDSAGYHELSVSLADNPAHAVLAHQAIKDSLKIK